jgi:hypothetical protein
MTIDYTLIAKAVEFYTKAGYKYIEVPWSVPKATGRMTYPDLSQKTMWDTNYDVDVLVGSGEQGFLDMMAWGQLRQGKYVCVTPCFRYEPQPDYLHKLWFMKVELIDTISPTYPNVIPMLSLATEFYETVAKIPVTWRKMDEDKLGTLWDIEDKQFEIELGSYGVRQAVSPYTDETLTWIYGTGCAEPRTSTVLNKYGQR